MKKILIVIVFLMGSLWVEAQKETKKLVQFSGVVVSNDSLQPVPFTNIIVKNTYRGTVSDYYGYFSFVAQENDTVEFSSLSYQKSTFVIPNNLEESRYSLIQMLRKDTITLRTAVIYPWPTREQFKEAFLALEVPDDDLERARKNLAREAMRDQAINYQMDASMNYKNTMQNYQSHLYYAGQLPPNRLLDPIAWSKFVKAWKNGDLKKQN
jgi:hypothetical protein